jgi:hypothetical protein
VNKLKKLYDIFIIFNAKLAGDQLQNLLIFELMAKNQKFPTHFGPQFFSILTNFISK